MPPPPVRLLTASLRTYVEIIRLPVFIEIDHPLEMGDVIRDMKHKDIERFGVAFRGHLKCIPMHSPFPRGPHDNAVFQISIN
jgi:hypothetical protein